jgi:hypothetical protein
MGGTDGSTKEDDVNVKLVKFLSQPRPVGLHAIIRIINDDLSSSIEELLDGIFTSIRNLFPKCDRLLALRP